MAARRNGNGSRRVRATLVRFGPELLEDLKLEAELSGVSAAEYVREAVAMRIAYMAGRRGDRPCDDALDGATGGTGFARRFRELSDEKARLGTDNQALMAQSRQAANQSRRLKDKSRAERARPRQPRP